jgi:hypothetical protein
VVFTFKLEYLAVETIPGCFSELPYVRKRQKIVNNPRGYPSGEYQLFWIAQGDPMIGCK